MQLQRVILICIVALLFVSVKGSVHTYKQEDDLLEPEAEIALGRLPVRSATPPIFGGPRTLHRQEGHTETSLSESTSTATSSNPSPESNSEVSETSREEFSVSSSSPAASTQVSSEEDILSESSSASKSKHEEISESSSTRFDSSDDSSSTTDSESSMESGSEHSQHDVSSSPMPQSSSSSPSPSVSSSSSYLPPYIECPKGCSGHGSCDTSTGICKCSEGWAPPDCSRKIVTCDVNCSGHGHCKIVSDEAVCKCDEDYSGKFCDIKRVKCPNDCTSASNGNCDYDTGKCECKEGYWGDDCSRKDCTPSCIHGTCNTISGQCYCYPDWTGARCNLWLQTGPDMEAVQSISTSIGAIYSVLVSVFSTVLSFSSGYFVIRGIRGLFSGTMDFLQVIGASRYLNSDLPPDYIKFSSFFSWVNFIPPIIPFEIPRTENPSYGTEDTSLANYLGISADNSVVLYNIIWVGSLIGITALINGIVIFFKIKTRQLRSDTNRSIAKEATQAITSSVLRVSLLAYTGASVTIPAALFHSMIHSEFLLMAAALIVFVFFNFGLIVFISSILRRNRFKLNTQSMRIRFGFLYSEFKKDLFMFQTVVLVKKLCVGILIGLSLASNGMMRGSATSLTLIGILALYFLIICVVRPYISKAKNFAESASVFAQIFIVTFATRSHIFSFVTARVVSGLVISLCSIVMLFYILACITEVLIFQSLNRKEKREAEERAAFVLSEAATLEGEEEGEEMHFNERIPDGNHSDSEDGQVGEEETEDASSRLLH